MKAKPIDTRDEFLKELGASEGTSLTTFEPSVSKLQAMIPRMRLPAAVMGDLLHAVPRLADAYNQAIVSMKDISGGMERTKRVRWTAFTEIARHGTLSGDQIIEMSKVLANVDDRSDRRWSGVMKTMVIGAILIMSFPIVYIMTGGKVNLLKAIRKA